MATEEGGVAPALATPTTRTAATATQPTTPATVSASTPSTVPTTEGAAPDKKDAKPQPPPKAQAKSQKPQAGDAAAGKPLSNAELKKQQKAEKAARRAQAKASQPAPAGGAGGAPSGGAADAKAGKGKPKQDGQQAQSQQQQHAKAGSRSTTTPAAPVKESKPAVPECFSHLSMARRIGILQADKDVNPAVLALGQHMSYFEITDSITRLEATLRAFQVVLKAYTTPHGTTFSRHFTSHVLNPQIDYLTACRPMCFSMGNAIRWLKLQISKIDIDLPDSDAKKLLNESIDNFISERIRLADYVIESTAAGMIDNDEVILTYAQHHLVQRALLKAKSDGKRFRVILVDDPFERVGLAHAKALSAAGIPTTYVTDFGAVRIHLREVSRVLVAAEAMFSNGAMYARAGTSDIATSAADLGIRVVALCETINFTERVSIDSLTYNEIDPERCTDEDFRLLFDTTRDRYISVVVTELGCASPTSVPAILRKLEEL